MNLHPPKETHRVAYKIGTFFVSFGCPPLGNLSKFNIKRNKHCLYFEFKIQGWTSKRDSYCAAYCLYIIYLTKLVGLYFETAFLNLYNQMIQQH